MRAAPAILLYRSNRMERLADELARVLSEPLGGAFDQEWIVVPGRGMEVWLRTELSRRHGVWAGGALLFPRHFVERVFAEVLRERGLSAEAYRRARLLWPVMQELGALGTEPELERLRAYLAGDEPSGQRRYHLARSIADTFDQYLTYRPEMLRGWERGDDAAAAEAGEAWQPQLWRRLVARLGGAHTAALERDLLVHLSEEAPSLGGLPRRLSVFGVSSLPPMYVRVLAALSRHLEVRFFQLSPARGWWGDVRGAELSALALARGEHPEALHLTDDNPLLASLGKLGADLMQVMSDELEMLGVSELEPAGDLHDEPDTATLLGRLQADLLHARPGAWNDAPDEPGSMAILACHSPMREVEVLSDHLLALVDAGVQPHEIVVLMSDVEVYAPLVDAVLSRERGDRRFLPYRIADRPVRADSPVLEAFHRLLALVGGRAGASELLDLFALAPVRNKIGIAAEDVDVLRSWVVRSGVRWGIDAAHRASHQQPPVHENTWRFGLERILLGYAMAAPGGEMYAGVLPLDDVEGQQAALAGKLAAFCERVFRAMDELSAPRSMRAWRDALLALLGDTLAEEPDVAWQHERVRRALVELCESAEAAGFDEPLALDVVRALLDEHIEEGHPARGFLAGGITFCAMVPMRSIPFRVVCMLGMSDGVFPRSRRPSDFDLMGKPGAARPGDRSRRDDDRYLFLEALLSARERVLLTYTGQSIRDGSPKPASVVVGELLDYLRESHRKLGESDLVVRHPLQPFSPRYFDGGDPQLFSYAGEYRAGASRLTGARARETPRLFDAPLPPVETAPSLELSELVRFFQNPVRYLMNRRLGVDLREPDRDVPDREPIELHPLERYHIGDRLLALRIDGMDAETSKRVARASGALPPGTPGECDHDELLGSVDPIASRVPELRAGDALGPAPLELRVGDMTIMGEIGDRWEGGMVRHQFARVSARHVLALWVQHLAMAAAGLRPAGSVLIGRGPRGGPPVAALRLGPVDGAAVLLADLVELHRIGSCEPLLLFPQTSMALARSLRAGTTPSAALDKAQGVWREERDRDPHLVRVFGARTIHELAEAPLGEGGFRGPPLVEVSRQVFDPLLAHLEEL